MTVAALLTNRPASMVLTIRGDWPEMGRDDFDAGTATSPSLLRHSHSISSGGVTNAGADRMTSNTPSGTLAAILPCNDLDASERFCNRLGFKRQTARSLPPVRMTTTACCRAEREATST